MHLLQMKSNYFVINQVRMMLSLLAYNLTNCLHTLSFPRVAKGIRFEIKVELNKKLKPQADTNGENTVIVTHGNLMSLLLKNFNKDFRFNGWKKLSNSDVYLLKNENNKVTSECLRK